MLDVSKSKQESAHQAEILMLAGPVGLAQCDCHLDLWGANRELRVVDRSTTQYHQNLLAGDWLDLLEGDWNTASVLCLPPIEIRRLDRGGSCKELGQRDMVNLNAMVDGCRDLVEKVPGSAAESS